MKACRTVQGENVTIFSVYFRLSISSKQENRCEYICVMN
jgi:hypothetical protein